ncbi:hypothetical protein QQS21_007535 [Conoideocrella luteorostrata]|uniref:Uncharacterized protein n=1 Tax=Conoideocrella luteorostrata TaxID=1105319 RepID=A0AAJ0CLC0_9HYPO|nr:hypothetical protein QQS21_007535 [Conoideocrella luteorostrata]
MAESTSSAFTLPRYILLLEEYPEFKIINGLVQEGSGATVEDALTQHAQLTAAAINLENANPIGPHAWHTFCALIEVAKRTDPERQTKLIDFAINLQKIKVFNPATGEQLTSDGQLLWTEMPALGYTAADDWNEVDVTATNTPPEVCRRYENFIALLAQISSAYAANYTESTIDEMEFSFWSLRAFKEAFECTDNKPVTDSAVRVACSWLIYASDRLWANIGHGRVFDQRGDDPGVSMTHSM